MDRLQKQDAIIAAYLLSDFNPDIPNLDIVDLDTFTDSQIDELFVDFRTLYLIKGESKP